jgi:hypothetical protein
LTGIYEPALDAVIDAAFERLHETLDSAGPTVAARVRAWMESMGGIDAQISGYKHPRSYPMLLLPWWAEKTIQNPPDAARQTDLVYSTINGYYAIRLIDNLMDGHATVELGLLPALHVFSAEFARVYHDRFAGGHPFWVDFHEIWYGSAELTLRDAGAVQIDRTHFEQVTARKTQAVSIPIAAVCYSLDCPGRLPAWREFVDLFGRWHQMSNDLFDWRKDLELGTKTYLLAEAERRAELDETILAWLARAGFAWAVSQLDGWMARLGESAHALDSPDLLAYLDTRDQMLAAAASEWGPALEAVSRLLGALSEAEGGR